MDYAADGGFFSDAGPGAIAGGIRDPVLFPNLSGLRKRNK
jgi:hypothetical protein